jgi:hypothetical protein
MNVRDLEAAILRALEQATGGVGDRPIEPERPLAEQFDFDPGHFASALAREIGIDVPVEDRASLATLSACLDYFDGDLPE